MRGPEGKASLSAFEGPHDAAKYDCVYVYKGCPNHEWRLQRHICPQLHQLNKDESVF